MGLLNYDFFIFGIGAFFGIILSFIFYVLWLYSEQQQHYQEERMVQRLTEYLNKQKTKK